MWIVSTFLTFLCWGVADLFYKISNKDGDNYQHLKTGMVVGVVMGIHATIFLFFNPVKIEVFDFIKYLPVSLLYILSMVIGYRGLKYLELSISSPIQNCSGVITALLLALFFKETFAFPFYIAVILIVIGIVSLSIIEVKEKKSDRVEYKKSHSKFNIFFLTICFPLMYCLLDGMGTFLDGIYLDKLSLIDEDVALVVYEYTFFIYAFITFIFLKLKKVSFNIFEKQKLLAALFETGGQFFYVYAMAGNATISAPIVGSYCVLSMLLSRIFLKEKLTMKEYFAIVLVFIGILILGILDI